MFTVATFQPIYLPPPPPLVRQSDRAIYIPPIIPRYTYQYTYPLWPGIIPPAPCCCQGSRGSKSSWVVRALLPYRPSASAPVGRGVRSTFFLLCLCFHPPALYLSLSPPYTEDKGRRLADKVEADRKCPLLERCRLAAPSSKPPNVEVGKERSA